MLDIFEILGPIMVGPSSSTRRELCASGGWPGPFWENRR